MAKYILFEGTEGAGKGTQIEKIVKYLEDKGYSVLQTKEPGTPHLKVTEEQRKIMLDNKYKDQMSKKGRELQSQSIRSNHLVKVIEPGLKKYDFIIQDRGLVSGLAYGEACDNPLEFLEYLSRAIVADIGKEMETLYDLVIYLDTDAKEGLKRAKNAKQEFEEGDAMESQGDEFMLQVQENFYKNLKKFNSEKITVEILDDKEKGIEKTFNKIIQAFKDHKILEQKDEN